jgi:hypothetical protein
MNSRAKGKRGEREAASFLTGEGFPARRGCQFAGSPDSPDILCPALSRIHVEVKRTQRTDLYGWLAQAKSDAGRKLPVVLHRKNDAQWVAILDARDFLALVRETDLPRAGQEQSNREAETQWPSTKTEGTEP